MTESHTQGADVGQGGGLVLNTVQICAMARSILLILALPYTLRFSLFEQYWALCLSWWQRDPVGTAWSKQVAPQPGQAQGHLIHTTPPLVPTGPWDASISMHRIPRFGRQHSSGASWFPYKY